MIYRCSPKAAKRQRNYGARGITVCARWATSFEAFLADMGERPVGLTLDRIDNDGNYDPGNCRWGTAEQQHNNTRPNRHVVVHGERMTVTQAARRYEVNESVLRGRLRIGWSLEKALTEPVRPKG